MRGFIDRLLYRWLFRRDLKMIDEFIGTFPGKCMVCSYHRYGFTHGYIEWGEPVPPHECIEKEAER